MDPQIQRLIEDLQTDVQDLIQVMRNLSNVVSATASQRDIQDKAIDQTVKQMGAFGKTIKDNVDAVEKSTEAQKKSSEDAIKTEKEKNQIARENFVYQRRQRSAFRDLVQEMSSTRGAMARFDESLLDNNTKLGSFAQSLLGGESGVLLFGAAVKGTTAGLAQMAKALYQGQVGALVAGQSFSTFASTVGTALQGIGLALLFIPGIGQIFGLAGLAARGLGAAAGAAGLALQGASQVTREFTSLSDRLVDVYQDLAKVGVAASDGMLGLAQSAQQLGYGLDEGSIRQFAELMRSGSTELALLGGTVAAGRKQFTEFNSLVRDDVGRELENLGFLPAQINEAVMAFTANQISMGRSATLRDREATKSAAEYIRQLDLLTKLTGQDAKTLQGRMNDDLREERFRAGLMRIERTQGAAAAETLRRNIAAIGLADPVLAKGLKDLTGGVIDTAEAANLARMGILQIPEAMTQSLGGGFQELASIVNFTATNMGEMLGSVGLYNQVYGDLTAQLKFGQFAQRDFTALLEQANEQQRQQQIGAEGLVGAQTDLRRDQRDLRDELQDLVKTGVVPTTEALKTLMNAANTAGQALLRGAGVSQPPGQRMGTAPAVSTPATAAPSISGASLTPRQLFDFKGGITGNAANFDQLEPGFRQRLLQMAAEYYQITGRRLPFGSGQRSAEDNASVGGVSSSLHLTGQAADLSSKAVDELVSLGLLQRYGFKQNATSSWHISDTGFRDGGVAAGPKTGYAAILHGREAVVPLPDGQSIPVTVKPQTEQTRDMLTDEIGRLGRFVQDLAKVQRQTSDLAPMLQEMIALQRTQNNTAEKMLMVAQN